MSIPYKKIPAWKISSTAAIYLIQRPPKFTGSVPPTFPRNRLNRLEFCSSSLWFPCKCNARALGRHNFSLYGFRLFYSKVKHLTEWFFNSGSGSTVSLQPMATSLNNAAKVVTFVNLSNFHFTLARSFVHDSMKSVLFFIFLTFVKSSIVATSLDLSNSVLFLCP